MAMAPPSSGGLETKHFILAALAATLVAATVVTVVSVVLSPARLSFSVTDARNDFTSHPARLFLTLTAQNPSRRAAVQYWSIFVEVSNDSSGSYIGADVSAQLPLYQRRRSETKVNATVSIVGLAEADAFTSNKTNRKLSVMVAAVARFKVGVAWTRLYDIYVSCGNIDFFANNQSSTADCHAD